MTSPISSPQNIFAIQEMGRDAEPPSWLAWFAVALPVACLGNLACWGCLLLAYRPGRTLKEVRRMPTSSVKHAHHPPSCVARPLWRPQEGLWPKGPTVSYNLCCVKCVKRHYCRLAAWAQLCTSSTGEQRLKPGRLVVYNCTLQCAFEGNVWRLAMQRVEHTAEITL